MTSTSSPLAVVTGASSGIGLQLALCCAREGFDLVLATDTGLGDAASQAASAGATAHNLPDAGPHRHRILRAR